MGPGPNCANGPKWIHRIPCVCVWQVNRELLDFSQKNRTVGILSPWAASIEVAEATPDAFRFVSELSTLSVADSAFLPCEDLLVS